MTAPMVRIDSGEPVRLETVGYTSPRSAHLHLAKHLLRLGGLGRDELLSEDDGERWSELIGDPPLATGLRQRRARALERLRGVAGCRLGREAPAEGSPCEACIDSSAIRRVGRELEPLLDAYLAVGRDVFDWAVRNPNASGPRLVAFRTDRDEVRVKAVDARSLVAVGRLEPPRGALRLLTCFRSKERKYSQSWLRLARERAGHSRAGTLVPIEPA